MKTKILLGLSIVYLLASVGCKKESAQAPVGGAGAPPTGKKAQVLTFTSPATMSNRSSLTATVSSSAGKAGGAITYVIQAGSGSATVNPTSGLITAVSVGTVTLTANSAGDAAYNPATASQLITINNKQPQKLTWNTPLLSNMTVDDKKPAAVTGAIGKVTYTITATGGASATVSTTGEVTAITAGEVTLIATAAGDDTYNPATAIQTITINAKAKKTQKLTWNTPLLSTMIEGETKTATVNDAIGKVTYTITAAVGGGSATVDADGKVTAITAGEVTLIATAAGDDTYNLATASQKITITARAKQTQTLTLEHLDDDDNLVSGFDDAMTKDDVSTGFLRGFISGAKITATSSDPTKATVTIDQTTGAIKVSAVNNGNADIDVVLTFSSLEVGDYASASINHTITILAAVPPPTPSAVDESTFTAQYSADAKVPLLTMTSAALKAGTEKVLVVVYEPAKTVGKEEIKFWGTIESDKVFKDTELSLSSYYVSNTTADAKQLKKNMKYSIAVYSVDSRTDLLTSKATAAKFVEANKSTFATGVLQKQIISYTKK